MSGAREILWVVRHPWIAGAERCRLSSSADGWSLAGDVVAAVDGEPIVVRYEVRADAGWTTRSVEVVVAGGPSLRLDHDGDGTWTVDGARCDAVAGCRDVDLGVTPSTNTLPIRRLDLAVGAAADVRVAWVRFPALDVAAGDQRYERLDDDRYRYASGDFSAELDVDADGLVVRYGAGLWEAVVRR